MNYDVIAIDGELRLVQLQPDQAAILFELTDSNREYLGKYLPWVPLVQRPEDSRRHIEETLESRAAGLTYTYGIELEGDIVGDISIRNLRDDTKSPEIGYWISPDYSGRGITTRAVEALTSLGLTSLGLTSIVIRADPENIASNKVAKKAGYLLIATTNEDGAPHNVWSIKNS